MVRSVWMRARAGPRAITAATRIAGETPFVSERT